MNNTNELESKIKQPVFSSNRVTTRAESTQKRVLCLWFPNWPIQRLVVSQPELRRQRVVLFRRDARRGQVISAASPLAMQGGVCVDMPLSEAKSLLRRAGGKPIAVEGGDFHILEHDLQKDTESFEVLADSLESFSPIVGLESVDKQEYKRGRRPDSLLLEVTGLAHLFGGEQQLACQLLVHCQKSGYLPRIAIADSVAAAWALARYMSGQYFLQTQQPLVLPPGDQETLKQLPIEALRLEPTVTDTLYQLGIETVEQLQRLPRNDLAMRFGNAIHRRMDQLSGTIEEPVVARRKPAEFMAEQLLEFPTHHRETIEVIIARLVGLLCDQMRGKQRGALEWTIKLVCQTGSPLEFRVNLFQPTALTEQVMPLVEMQLEQVLSPHTRKSRRRKSKRSASVAKPKPAEQEEAASENQKSTKPLSESAGEITTQTTEFYRYTTIQVQEIEVAVTSDVLLAQQQRQLFDENPRLDRQLLAHLINRLASRLGTENVVYPKLQSGAQPEYSFRLHPLVDPTRKRRRRKTKPPVQSHALARPLRLFQPPLRLRKCEIAIAVQPGNSSASQPANQSKRLSEIATTPPPALLQLENQSGNHTDPQKILSACGPERIETGWWRGVTVCREYWRVETETHQHYWIFRNLRSGEWFLHGEF